MMMKKRGSYFLFPLHLSLSIELPLCLDRFISQVGDFKMTGHLRGLHLQCMITGTDFQWPLRRRGHHQSTWGHFVPGWSGTWSGLGPQISAYLVHCQWQVELLTGDHCRLVFKLQLSCLVTFEPHKLVPNNGEFALEFFKGTLDWRIRLVWHVERYTHAGTNRHFFLRSNQALLKHRLQDWSQHDTTTQWCQKTPLCVCGGMRRAQTLVDNVITSETVIVSHGHLIPYY